MKQTRCKSFRNYFRILALVGMAALFFIPSRSFTQSGAGFIYGEIILKNGSQYRGQIRWEDEEALWDDIFDASKHERPMQHLLTQAEARRVEARRNDFKFGFMALWEDKSPDLNFSFRCRFGDIVSLRSLENEIFLLTLKNGAGIKLKRSRGGDLNDDIIIYDTEVGRVELDFGDIQSILFQSVPAGFTSPWGDPVYGRVLTTMGVFEGYISWDGEERLGKDLISGRQDGVVIDIEFEDITELKAQNDGSLIRLHSGRTLFLHGHDDVGPGNHGITIRNLSFGQLECTWENFISVTFLAPPIPPPSYADFPPPQLLPGQVVLKNGAVHRGQIIYDLDEIYDIELLNGENNNFAYVIPFRNIAKIEPQNDRFSIVHLIGGGQLLLSNNPDVNMDNHGLVLKQMNGTARYFEWKDIKNIDFE